MKLRLFFAGLAIVFALRGFGQDSLKKTNPVIYFGTSFSLPLTQSGVQLNLDLNYQVRSSLYTLRFVGAGYFDVGTVALSPINYFPTISGKGGLEEYGVLYGRRFIHGGHAFSFSAGASFNDRTGYVAGINNQPQHYESYYVGLPFEMNVLWFKPVKRRYRVYRIFPVGKPTAFGDSFGFKLAGNVSEHSYISLGIVFGMGNHKEY
jgi:hypothetical protein